MTATTRKQGRTNQWEAPLVTYAYVARRRLVMEGGVRQPGQLVPEVATWKGKVRQCYLDLGWVEQFALVSDSDREAFDAQWKREEAARQEAISNAPKPEPPKASAPPPRPVSYNCANCGALHTWEAPPADHQWFRCQRCHQNQTVSMARAGSMKLVSPAFNHGHKAPTFRQES
jgi:ribosomal protein L44E